jgi:hypothetical protein
MDHIKPLDLNRIVFNRTQKTFDAIQSTPTTSICLDHDSQAASCCIQGKQCLEDRIQSSERRWHPLLQDLCRQDEIISTGLPNTGPLS